MVAAGCWNWGWVLGNSILLVMAVVARWEVERRCHGDGLGATGMLLILLLLILMTILRYCTVWGG